MSRPTYKGANTCSNPFWFDYMQSYFQFDHTLRPTFATIEKHFEEISHNCSQYFIMPDIKMQTRTRTENRPSHVSSDRGERSTTTTMVDFIDSQAFDPLANDKENYQNYQNIVNLATTSRNPAAPGIPPRRSMTNDSNVNDDVFAPIQPPAMPGIHSTPAPSSQKSFNANYRTMGNSSYMNDQPTMEHEPLLSPIPRQVSF